MPQRDSYHDAVKQALIADGWTITHDPYAIAYTPDQVYVDLGAEQLLAAEQGARRIAVEVKTLLGPSLITEVEHALGQYLLYQSWMRRSDAERVLYLAVSLEAAANTLSRPGVQVLLADYHVRVLVVDIAQQEVVEWQPPL